ncbi:MAG: phosphate ABC transporter permease PstA [Acidimicrobiia bacterium]
MSNSNVPTIDLTSTMVDSNAELATALRGSRGAREIRDAIATGLMILAVLLVMIPLALVIGNVVAKGGSVLSWSFLTEDIPSVRKSGPGLGPAVFGTLAITGVATALSVPLGIFGAIYLNEYAGPTRLARLIRFMSYVMTGVPSIVMGLFIYTVWVLHGSDGFNAFAGALALACLMLPIVIRSTEEMLRLVPNSLREASLALGTTKARTICTVVMPAALPGVVSGCLLAVARAAGETAPIVVVVGLTRKLNTSLLHGQNTTLSAQIYANAAQPFDGAKERAYGAALTLVLLAFGLTLIARFITARLASK